MQLKLFLILLSCFNYSLCSSIPNRLANWKPLQSSENYTHVINVDEYEPQQYVLYWKFDKNEIQFEIHCKTLGWVGFGLSPNGGMSGIKYLFFHILKNNNE